jgi:hypothetical protein
MAIGWSSEIGAFKPLPSAVADVENVHDLVPLCDAIDHTIDVGSVSVKKVS